MTDTVITLKEPRLGAEEKLYLSAYMSTLSDSKAYKLVRPDLKSHPSSNPFSRSDAVKYHKKKRVVLKAEAIGLSEDRVLELLLQEATRLGNGSSPTARVQALTLLGKHLGLFEEKKREEEGVVFNIVNYSSPLEVKEDSTKELEDSTKELEDSTKELESLPPELKIENYE